MGNYLLGADIGTSSIKASVFTLDGKEVACSSLEYGLHFVGAGGVEQNPEDWWHAFKLVLGDMRQKTRIELKDIGGIGISSQSWAVIPLDKRGETLHSAIIWMDRRATQETEWLKKRVGDDAGKILIDPSYILPKILWLKNHDADAYNHAKYFLQASGYINYRLCERASTDLSQEDPLQIYVGNTPSFLSIESFYDSLELDQRKIPTSSVSHEVIGEVSKRAAEETGLRWGTPIVAGAMDTSATALGMNITNAGQTFHVAGQAGAVGACLGEPRFDPRVCIHNHVVPGRWLVAGVMVATGASMRWLRDLVSDETTVGLSDCTPEAFEEMSERASDVAIGSGGLVFVPYMMGERTPIWDYQARGIMFGLSLKTGKPELIRCVMEGCAYALRDNIEVLESLGIEINDIVCSGGAVKSRVWNQIKADVAKKRLFSIGTDICAPRGAAMLAGRGAGILNKDVWKQDARCTSFEPNAHNSPAYDCLYGVYKRLYQKTKEEFKEIARTVSECADENR